MNFSIMQFLLISKSANHTTLNNKVGILQNHYKTPKSVLKREDFFIKIASQVKLNLCEKFVVKNYFTEEI